MMWIRIINSSKSAKRPQEESVERPQGESVEKPQKVGGFEKPQKVGGFEKPQKVGGVEKPQKVGGVEKPQKVGGVEKPQKVGGFEKPQKVGGVEKPLPLLQKKTTRRYYHTFLEYRKELLENLHATREHLSDTRRELDILKLTVSKRERRKEQKRLMQLINELSRQEVVALQKWLDDCDKQKY
jgi:hypothetical protein